MNPLSDLTSRNIDRLKGQTPEQRRAILRRAAIGSRQGLGGVSTVLGALAIGALILVTWFFGSLVLSRYVGNWIAPTDLTLRVMLVASLFTGALAVYFLRSRRLRQRVDQGLRYCACPRCDYPLVKAVFRGHETTCPECGLTCSRRALAIDPSEVDERVRRGRPSALARLYASFVTAGLAHLAALTWTQRLGVIRAASVIRRRSAIVDVVVAPIVVILGIGAGVVLLEMLGLVLPRQATEWAPPLYPVMVLCPAFVLAALYSRWRLRRIIRRDLPRPMCLACGASEFVGEAENHCVVCAKCQYVNSLYEMGLRGDEVVPADRMPSAPASRQEARDGSTP